ncbi:hypothetical protein CBS101457_002264 [Exobasidium rhododendri]|nr:hypothetical protein CBS101457_002264 [Exobasidium rhododendri]
MLPTHIVRVEQTSESAHQGEDGGMVYSPRRQEFHDLASRRGRRIPSLQSKVFGERGVTSFTVQAQTPYDKRNDADNHIFDDSTANDTARKGTSPSRWNTLEFYFYAVVFAIAVPWMCWVPIRLSLESSKNYPKYSSHLRPGWLFGRKRDDSDFQYKSFRDYFPVLTLVMIVYVAISKGLEHLGRQGSYQSLNRTLIRPHRKLFLTLFTFAFIVTLHGTNAMKLLLLCSINFAIVKIINLTTYSPIAPLVIWTWNVASLFAVHWNNGFSYATFSQSLAWLDNYTGLMPRWQINFNITMLRLISFSIDYYWAAKDTGHTNTAHGDEVSRTSIETDSRKRQETPLPMVDYSFRNYLLYALYPPLFIAGPIITFNDFVEQLRRPLSISSRYTLQYAIRFLATVLTMEFILHYMYVNAIKDSKAWAGSTPMELSMIGFWNLIVVWLKLLIPWRFFRLWALADGVDAPENMIRCMANNYSTLGFWRSWHRSYNLWIVRRYIYIPMGGSGNAIASILLVFTFVALWHDLSLKLLAWGWLVSLFILPEILARKAVSKELFGQLWWYRHICAVGGVVNILMMMSANLVGFAIGMEGMSYMSQQLLSRWSGLQFMLGACGVLFVGVQVMFEYREEELRRGTIRKC